MQRLFPDSDESELVRFLIARKGAVDQAAPMLRAARHWHAVNFPSKLKEIIPALRSGCFFAHGKARDGTPTLYFRGALYDSKVATPMQYALAAAYVIDKALAENQQEAVTVIVHVSRLPDAPNEAADLHFIKSFVKVLSENYPERLKRLVLYPFPLFGRVVWSIVKVFVDKRSQDKVVLLQGKDGELPAQLLSYVDPKSVPACCGGLDTTPVKDVIEDVRATIERGSDMSLAYERSMEGVDESSSSSSSSISSSGAGRPLVTSPEPSSDAKREAAPPPHPTTASYGRPQQRSIL
jgi:hypothetical protein